jgi:LPXTG-motif cell wall-anchored protein
MAPLLRGVLADGLTEPPLIGNNAVFYSVVGAVLLVLLLLVWWFRRARWGG